MRQLVPQDMPRPNPHDRAITEAPSFQESARDPHHLVSKRMPASLAARIKALRAIFEDLADGDGAAAAKRPASGLIKKMERELLDNVFRWTGHFPERTRVLLRHLAQLADQLGLGYPEPADARARMAVTTLVTALAMNHVHTGGYMP